MITQSKLRMQGGESRTQKQKAEQQSIVFNANGKEDRNKMKVSRKELSSVQQRYILAKDRYIDAKKKFKELKKDIDQALDTNEISANDWVQRITDLEITTGLEQAQDDLHSAEQDLVEWARGKIKQEITGEQIEQLSILWENWRHPSIKQDVIDLCMRLES